VIPLGWKESSDGDVCRVGRWFQADGGLRDRRLRDKPLTEIDQISIDNAASALYPNAPAITTNRQFYTPVSAVLKRAGIEREIKRPKGWRGSKATEWLEPEQAFPLIDAAYDGKNAAAVALRRMGGKARAEEMTGQAA